MQQGMNEHYSGATIIMPTKHAKSWAVAPPVWKHLEASVLEFVVDTDALGTFSGEVERKGNALECARRKCELGIERLGSKADYCLSSEGSFIPHPLVPFLALDQEILYFIDMRRGFHLHEVYASEKTNYQAKTLGSWDELAKFASSTGFPSHALVLRPNDRAKSDVLFKGIVDSDALRSAYQKAKDVSSDRLVFAETDMRAQFNPLRMAVIGELAEKLAKRLATACPACRTPGWGMIASQKGLRCEYCNQPTGMIAVEIDGCVLCDRKEIRPRSDGLHFVPQINCLFCNP